MNALPPASEPTSRTDRHLAMLQELADLAMQLARRADPPRTQLPPEI